MTSNVPLVILRHCAHNNSCIGWLHLNKHRCYSFCMPAPDASSLVDLVNDDDHVIGKCRRGEADAGEGNFRVAHVFVFSASGKLLLAQLGSVRTKQPGAWGSSVAAQLWSGETYQDAAQRRLVEELGISSPVQHIDTVRMREEARYKFVGLFSALSDDPHIREPDHIASIASHDFDEVVRLVAEQPERFTPTFRLLLRVYLRSQLEGGSG